VTGHTGFKGAWLALWLHDLGARVEGFALPPATEPNLFDSARLGELVESRLGDVRAPERLAAAVAAARPEVVFHLAAQAIVRESYRDPRGTFATNVMGTVNLLEAVRAVPSVRAVVIVTTDKVYENLESGEPFTESEPLGGRDPYSASKAGAELVARAYRDSFLSSAAGRPDVAVATARAGNVIGGGDWAADRLVPDVIRAILAGSAVELRHPEAVRPWQDVLEPLAGYLRLAERLVEEGETYAEAWNFAPRANGARPVGWLVERIHGAWGRPYDWQPQAGQHPHEARFLSLDATKAVARLGWRPKLGVEQAVDRLVDWYRRAVAGEDARELCRAAIRDYEATT
jgi:CDP-glucose 4,6-dehydratase